MQVQSCGSIQVLIFIDCLKKHLLRLWPGLLSAYSVGWFKNYNLSVAIMFNNLMSTLQFEMTTPSGPPLKRSRFTPTMSVTDSNVKAILRNAQEIPFPWVESMPKKISEWFNIICKAHNTKPEFMFVTALSTTACLMGPDTVISIRETYSEPTNMFTVCVGQPGCGKSQTFRLAILDPLKEVM